MSEAPPPPAPPVVATSRFQAKRFVLPHPEDAAPLFPILGRSTDNESTPRIGYSIVPIPSENVALFDEEKMEEVEDRTDNGNGSARQSIFRYDHERKNGITTSINAEQFKLNLSSYLKADMDVFKELEGCIFSRA